MNICWLLVETIGGHYHAKSLPAIQFFGLPYYFATEFQWFHQYLGTMAAQLWQLSPDVNSEDILLKKINDKSTKKF